MERLSGRHLRRQKRHDGAYYFSHYCGPGSAIRVRNAREAVYWRNRDNYWLLMGLLHEALP